MYFSLNKRQGAEIPIIEMNNVEDIIGDRGGNTVRVLKKLEGCLALLIPGTNFTIENARLGWQLRNCFYDTGEPAA